MPTAIVRQTPALRVALTPERPVLAFGQRRARFLLEVDAKRPAGGARHLVVALDRSSSMAGERLDDALEALRTLICRAPEGMALSAFAFDAEITELFGRTELRASSRPLLLRRLHGITHGLGTDHGAALMEGLRLGNTGDGVGHLLLITDGYPSRGARSLETLVELVRRSRGETTVSTLGIGEHAEGWVLGALARTGGGIYQHVARGLGEPTLGPILPAIGAELGLLHHHYAADIRVRFDTHASVGLRKLYYRGPAWKADGARVVRLPRLVEGEPLRLSFELEGDPGADWGQLEVRVVSADGEERRFELPIPACFDERAGAIDPYAAEAILEHRVGVALIDACTAGEHEAARAARWLGERLAQLGAIAEHHGLEGPRLKAAFEQAAELRATLGERRLSEARKNRLSELAEWCTRGVSSATSELATRTRVTGLEMLEG